MLKEPKKPEKGISLRAYSLLVVAVLALSSSILKPIMQSWYSTMPSDQAKTIGLVLILTLMVVVGVIGYFVVQRGEYL